MMSITGILILIYTAAISLQERLIEIYTEKDNEITKRKQTR